MKEALIIFVLINTLIIVTVFGAVAIKNHDKAYIKAEKESSGDE